MNNTKRFFLLILIVLILNIIWEFSHYKFYTDLSGIPFIPHLLLASFTDAFILFLIFTLISLIHNSVNWVSLPSKLDYLVILVLTISIALTIEIINLNLGRWAYTIAMPTIFGVGLSPLLQLSTTAILPLLMIKKIKD